MEINAVIWTDVLLIYSIIDVSFRLLVSAFMPVKLPFLNTGRFCFFPLNPANISSEIWAMNVYNKVFYRCKPCRLACNRANYFFIQKWNFTGNDFNGNPCTKPQNNFFALDWCEEWVFSFYAAISLIG